MITIIHATERDIPTIQSIAHRTWPNTFGDILSPEQIEYMLDMMYSPNALTEQLAIKKHQFLLAIYKNETVGYLSYELNYKNENHTKIHKIYILPEMQGKSIGKKLINAAESIAKANSSNTLLLNVNRENPALIFYERMGFHKAYEEEIPIGNNFWMIDYVMEKEI